VAQNGLLTRVEELVGSELQEVDRIFLGELDSWHVYVTDVLGHVTRFRGKRLRPSLLLLSAAATGRITRDHKILAAVVEMVHTATLVHDDVLDEAATRRHAATVNARWNNETSVLFGDYLFTHSFHLASALDSIRICRLIGRATNTVCEGELAQIHERGNFDLTEESYLQIIDAKTAELCALCCRLGAHVAGAEDAVADAIERYGRSLGIAFQIADDILDLLGCEEIMGKSLGTDLQKQKLTLPLIRLLNTSEEPDATHIRELLAHPNAHTRQALEPYLGQSDAIEYAYNCGDDYAAEARCSLECLDDSPARRVLEEITEFAVQRTF